MYNNKFPFSIMPNFKKTNRFYKPNYYNKTNFSNFTKNNINPINYNFDSSYKYTNYENIQKGKSSESFENIKFEKSTDSSQTNTNEVLFEILGIKIYFDDVLLICILLFLYQEGIQDEYLFISLILLLLS